MYKKFNYFAVLFIISYLSISTTNAANTTDFTQSIIDCFTKQWTNFPQEKIYLQTDKPYYSAGEDLWFKAYLVDATTHQPNALSQYIYVELIDKSDSVMCRVKIRKDSLGFSGNLKLKTELAAGNYSLRAYTFWMQNASSDYFFNKNIFIGNRITEGISSKISYGIPSDGKIQLTITFLDATQKPISGKKVFLTQNGNPSQKKKTTVNITNSDGKISWEQTINPIDKSRKSIDVSITEAYLKHKNRFYLPDFSDNFDLQFFPESGTLLTDELQTVAFKAIGADGLGINVTGKIFTNDNEEITDFSSSNKGMGKFVLNTIPNKSYYAQVKTNNGIEKRFNLPASQAEGVAIHLIQSKDKIKYEVKNQSNRPDKSLYLLLHSRGKVYVLQQLKELSGQINEQLLPSGIISCSVIDSTGNTLCERLSFVTAPDSPSITMTSNKINFGKRESANLILKVSDALGKPVAGNFSISITDKQTVKTDSLSDNIQSNLLLTSDLKGHIEEPASYFKDKLPSTREKLDLLMLTQGWRRFNTADIAKGSYKQASYYLEAGQAVSGKVTNLFGKASQNSEIIMLSAYKGLIKTTKTDPEGRFMISGIEFPDSTNFVLKAKKRKTIGDVEISIDGDEFPKASTFLPTPLEEKTSIPSEYLRQSRDKYYYEGGMRMIGLDEVTIKASKINTAAESQYYSGMSDAQINPETLEKNPSRSILSIISSMSGVSVIGDQVSIRGSANSPLFIIDGIETENTEDLSYLTTSDVEEISLFKGASASIFGSKGGNGVIAITLKKGVVAKTKTSSSLIHVSPLGYQKPSEFYSPKYEVDSIRNNTKPDLRTTIYWNPKLVCDSMGIIHINFSTADKSSQYTVIVEGITEKGETCRLVGQLRREDQE